MNIENASLPSLSLRKRAIKKPGSCEPSRCIRARDPLPWPFANLDFAA